MSSSARLLFVLDPSATAGDPESQRVGALAAALIRHGDVVDLATGDPWSDAAVARTLTETPAGYRAVVLAGDPLAWFAWVAMALSSPKVTIVMRPVIDERWLARWGARPDVRNRVARVLHCAHQVVLRASDGPEALFMREEGIDFACIEDDGGAGAGVGGTETETETEADIYSSFWASPEAGRETDMSIAALQSRAERYQLSFAQVQMMLDSGRLGEALSELERMVADDPTRAEGHNDLAVLYHSAGRLADAERAIRRAAELDPESQAIADNRAAISSALAGPRAAPLAAARDVAAPPALAPAPAPPPVSTPTAAAGYPESLRVAETLLADGRLEEAVAEIERFVEREPAFAEAWNDLGVLQHDAGKLEAARAALTVALTIDGQNLQTRRNLAGVLLEIGRTGEAAAMLEPVLAANPSDVGALVMAGDISVAIHQPGDALAFYRAALSAEPSNAEIAAKLAGLEVVVAPSGPRVLDYDPTGRQAAPEGWYDIVRCRTPLDYLPDPVGALKEMARALKPGGKMWFDVGCAMEATKHATATSEREIPRVGVTNGALPRPTA